MIIFLWWDFKNEFENMTEIKCCLTLREVEKQKPFDCLFRFHQDNHNVTYQIKTAVTFSLTITN
jgi:hypothetical protein